MGQSGTAAATGNEGGTPLFSGSGVLRWVADSVGTRAAAPAPGRRRRPTPPGRKRGPPAAAGAGVGLSPLGPRLPMQEPPEETPALRTQLLTYAVADLSPYVAFPLHNPRFFFPGRILTAVGIAKRETKEEESFLSFVTHRESFCLCFFERWRRGAGEPGVSSWRSFPVRGEWVSADGWVSSPAYLGRSRGNPDGAIRRACVGALLRGRDPTQH